MNIKTYGNIKKDTLFRLKRYKDAEHYDLIEDVIIQFKHIDSTHNKIFDDVLTLYNRDSGAVIVTDWAFEVSYGYTQYSLMEIGPLSEHPEFLL